MIETIFNLDLMGESLEITEVISVIIVALAISLFIFWVYTKTYKGVMYSSSFGVTLILMCLITALIIYSVAVNFLLSLGMVGALSIVRFRTVIKEPLDLAHLFWSISAGILAGAAFFTIAVIGSITIGIVLFIFAKHNPNGLPYIAIVSCDNESSEKKATEIVENQTKKSVIKSKTVMRNNIELTFEVRLKTESTQFVNALLAVEGVSNATLVSYNGDYYM